MDNQLIQAAQIVENQVRLFGCFFFIYLKNEI